MASQPASTLFDDIPRKEQERPRTYSESLSTFQFLNRAGGKRWPRQQPTRTLIPTNPTWVPILPGWRDGRPVVPRALLRRRALPGRLVLARHTARHVRVELLRGGAVRQARYLATTTGAAPRAAWELPIAARNDVLTVSRAA